MGNGPRICIGREVKAAARSHSGETGSLVVSEIFGPTLQGEGPHAGRPAAFLRVGRCNLTCGWCDSRYTWDRDAFDLDVELQSIPTREVLERLLSMSAQRIVITGGEPGLQADQLSVLAEGLVAEGRCVDVETNGTVDLGDLPRHCDLVVVSLKLASSGVASRRSQRPGMLRAISKLENVVFKFVVTDPSVDIVEIESIVRTWSIPASRIWVMPEGTNDDTLRPALRLLAKHAIDRGWSLSPRLHITLWGDTRGR